MNTETSAQNATTRRARRRGLFRTFLSYYQGQVHLFVGDTICALLVAGIDLAFPQILRTLTRGLFAQGADAIMGVLVYLAIGLVAMYLLRFACRYFVVYWGHVMGARMESRMREDLFDAYERTEFLLIGLVEIVGSFIILGTINVPLTLVMAVVLVALVALDVVANLRMRAVFTENRQRISGVNSRVEDSLEGARVVKSFAAEDVERAKFRRSNDAYLDSKVRMYRAMGVYQAAIAVMMGFLNVTIVVMGGWLIARGQMEAADLATFALYISLFTNPIDNILNFTETFQKAIAGFARFVEVLNEQPDIQDAPDARELRVTQGAISYSHVEFAYQKGEPVIRDLNLDVRPGETLALVGPSGGGKSTTCSLLPRFYDVEAGSITIDGQDVRKVTQKSLREAIGLVQQDVYLFDGTIAENIAYGRPDATPDQIRLAAQRARVDEFVRELPDGYETQVGERGTRLSGGQKQRIAIARVFLKNPPILIFDEATSALDNESEAAVQESLARLAEGRTTIVIAHRLSTIKDADEIATITDGTVSERGTHEELLAKNGTYAHYYRMQFE